MTSFSVIADIEDIKAALFAASQPNDLLPPRLEDRVSGEVGRRYWESLKRSLDRREYLPQPSIRVAVPKPGLTSRPAALLTLDDRVVFEGLIALLRRRAESFLPHPDVLMWPRSNQAAKRWQEFERAPLSVNPTHVAVVDVAGFYESIQHMLLERLVTEATGLGDVASALVAFLDRSMGSSKGLPQGLSSSDALAAIYLSGVDRAMLQTGFDYWRHGDDIRIATSSYWQGREAVAVVEEEVRRLGLFLNGQKSKVLRRSTYEARLGDYASTQTELRNRLQELRRQELASGDLPTLLDVARRVGVPEGILEPFAENREWLLQTIGEWHAGLGPYEEFSTEEAIQALSEVVEPRDVDIARATFAEAIKNEPRSGGWSEERFHVAIVDSVTALAAADDPYPLESCAYLLELYPDKTNTIASYLAALSTSHPQEVETVTVKVLSGGFQHAWQAAWLYWACDRLTAGDALAKIALADATDEDAPWIRRSAAARVAGRLGVLDHATVLRLWRRTPPQFRPDLVGAAFNASSAGADWAEVFLDGCRGDRVLEVVIKHLEAVGGGSRSISA